jgi:hypothetical protein
MTSGNGSPTLSKRRSGSARSQSTRSKTWRIRIPASLCCGGLLREQLQRVEQGLDPINLIRDPSANQRIPTGACNKILSPAEVAALPYSEDL